MVCVFTSLGCWLFIIRDQFQKKDLIVMWAGTHYSGAKTYAAQLKEMLMLYHREIMSMGRQLIRQNHMDFEKVLVCMPQVEQQLVLPCHL